MRALYGTSETVANMPLETEDEIVDFIMRNNNVNVVDFCGAEVLSANGTQLLRCLPAWRVILHSRLDAAYEAAQGRTGEVYVS